MPPRPDASGIRPGLRAARLILTLFTQETDLDHTAFGVLRALLDLDLLFGGQLVYDQPPRLVSVSDSRTGHVFQPVNPEQLLAGQADSDPIVLETPPGDSRFGGETGLVLNLPLEEPGRRGLLAASLTPTGAQVDHEDWIEISAAVAWVLERTSAHQSLETSHARYQRLFEHSEDFLFVSSEDGRWLEVNSAGVAMLGFNSREEMLAMGHVSHVYHNPADRDELLSRLRLFGAVRGFETTFLRKDGTPVEVMISAVRWEEGPGRSGLEGIIRDVTQANRNLRDLFICRHTTEGIIEGIPVAMFVLDEHGRVSHWNKACEALTGVRQETVIDTRDQWRGFFTEPRRTMADFVLRADLEGLHEQFEGKNLRRSFMVPGGFVAEDRFHLPGGERHLYISAAPIAGPDGRPRGAVQVFLDLTPRVRLERELMASEAKYRQMVELAWDGIVIHDRQSIHFANRSFRRMFGLNDREDLTGAALHRFLAPDTRRGLFEALRDADKATDGPVSLEGRGIRPDGSWFDLELSTMPVDYQGRTALQTVIQDITRRKQMEEQLIHSERLAAAGQLALNIAHEINNPLGGIITYTHLLLEDLAEGVPFEDLNDLPNKVLKLANRCKIIVGGLLDFARPDPAGREEVSINQIISETLSLLQGHVILNGVAIHTELETDLPPVLAERTKLEQVFMNLIINAAEAMPDGGDLIVETGFDIGRDMLCARIIDTGRGMTEEEMRRLFEPFFSTKSRGRGTGLGLAISHGIIKQHKGVIEVESQPGDGTTFKIWLPGYFDPAHRRG